MATGGRLPNPKKRNVLEVARQVSATIGTDFFRAMAKHLAPALEADCVFVGEFTGGRVQRVKTLAVFTGRDSDNFEFELADSAAAKIALGKAILCRAGAQRRFASDGVLAGLHAEAFVGFPLANSEGTPIGVLMAVFGKAVQSLSTAKSILEVFAPRAAAELERKQEYERLRESEQRYRVFVLLNSDAMWRIEFEQPISTKLPEEQQIEQIYRYGYLAECNDAAARYYGLERASQLTGWRVNDLAPMSNPSIHQANLEAIRAGYRFTTVKTSPIGCDGKQHYALRSQWGIVEDGMLQRIWGTNRDITDLVTIERELDASEHQMADLLETLRLLVVMLHEDGTIARCNKHLHRLTGWSSGAVAGKNWFDLMVPPEDRAKAQAAFASAKLRAGSATHYESALLGPKGRRWWIAWDTTCLRDAEGNIVISANVGRDISEYKILEAQFQQAQRLESIGRLAGGVAHDFNNLLAVITGYNSLLLAKTEASDPAYTGLVEIGKAAEKGAELTHRLLTFSRRQTPRAEPLDLSALIAADEQMVRRLIGEDVELITHLEPSLDLVRADTGQLRQVLLNLVVNAWDAMPNGGSLTISTSNRELGDKEANRSGASPGRYVELTVADTGSGMTKEVQSHLFEPFYTTKEQGKGTGLGLSTVFGIVRKHGGHIDVKSKPGKGTRFKILLPGLPAEPASPAS